MTPCLLQCKMQSEKCKIQNDGMNGFTFDALVRSPQCCHCEERSDAAISFFQTVTNYEIASLRSQRRLLELFTNASIIAQEVFFYGFWKKGGDAKGSARSKVYLHNISDNFPFEKGGENYFVL